VIVRRAFLGVLLILAGGLLATFLLPAIAPNFPKETITLAYRVVYVSILVIVVSWLWAFFSIRGVEVRRTARGQRQSLGQVFEERFEVINRYPFFRVWLEIRDLSTLPGNNGSRVFSWLGGREHRNYTSYTLLTRRGEFELGPTVITSGDPFGLFGFKKATPNLYTVLVMPYFVELQNFPIPPGLLTGGKALRRKAYEVTPQSAGVREHFPGDGLARIHWPSTARRDRLMVKEFDQDPQSDVWIFLDAQKEVHYGQLDPVDLPKTDKLWLWRKGLTFSLPPSTFEYAVTITASVSNFFLNHGQAVGIASAGHVYSALTAERGDRQQSKILETLAFLRPEGQLPLLGLVEAQIQNIPRGSVVVLITASSLPSIATAAEALAGRKIKPVVILIDPVTFGGLQSLVPLSELLNTRKIPLAIIKKGDDIKNVLENGFSGTLKRSI
jgi:uncharacterized protein (DUF58 family)